MSLEVKIHVAQTKILRELLFQPSAGFAELQKPTGLSSDHFNFHIGRLVELELIEKVERGQYALSSRGKEYANKLDTDSNTIERQPKSAVILAIEREYRGQKQFLFQERLKQPYFGYWGLPSGKIRWGETITETALRESLEETGLSADFRVAGVYHEHVKIENQNDMVEDKIFFVCHGTNPKGTLIREFEGGKNQWMSFEVALKKELRFESFEVEIEILKSKKWLFEQTVIVPKQKF